jgi:preprotein translocase subunit SecG
MGVRKTTDFLEKATWTLGIALVFVSVLSAGITGGSSAVDGDEGAQSKMMEQIDEKSLPVSVPAASSIPLPANETPPTE